MKISEKTNIGLVRSSNQDACRTGTLKDGAVWAVVCDGMGGASGGDIASSKAVDIISGRIESCYHITMKDSSIGNMLESAINLANIEIYDYAREHEKLTGMGTTVVAAIVTDDKIYISHAGDSRAYIVNKHALRQITVDHSVVQEMVDRGELTPEQAQHHPIKNYITRALGVDDRISVDFNVVDFDSDDIFLICTDGFSNLVSDEETLKLLKDADGSNYAEILVDAANKNGGTDNITVVTVTH